MEDRIKALDGITYPEWLRLREAVDRYFTYKKSELDNEIKLTEIEKVTTIIHSQFGRI